MSPLDLEMYHQIKNVIGVLTFYEYLFIMVDADTSSYNRWSFVGKPCDLSVCLFFLAFTNIHLTKMLGRHDLRQETARRLRKNRVG